MDTDGIREGILPSGEMGTFWNLSSQVHILAMCERVMLWLMRCPQGLIGQNELNPERRQNGENNR